MSIPVRDGSEAGFTLVEALCAIVILVFGLMAIANLMVVGAANNTVGNQSTAATTFATEIMERLKAIRFGDLATGGDLTTSTGSIIDCDDNSQNCVVAGNFNAHKDVRGVGRIQARWQISAVDGQILHIVVRAEGTAPLAVSRSRAEFTTFRTCTSTSQGCPGP